MTHIRHLFLFVLFATFSASAFSVTLHVSAHFSDAGKNESNSPRQSDTAEQLWQEVGKNILLVKAGNAESLLKTLLEAGERNTSPKSKRLFILIPNGVYDLGEKVLTTVMGYNITLVGESMDSTIIMNAPKVENEGISSTGTLLNRAHDIYVQDLTLKNALDYYHSGPAGRAVCWQDKGLNSIFKRVRMLSYQDTYYSHSEECQHYMEDCEIHGNIDFICGAGDVLFKHCNIVVENRNEDGSGWCVIAAPRTSTTRWGFVFDECTIINDKSGYKFARGWHTSPRCAWINTRLMKPQSLMETRFDAEGIRAVNNEFWEYGTTDAEGRLITPASNKVTFTCKGDTNTVETTMSQEMAKKYAHSPKAIFPKWRPDKKTRQLEKQCQKAWTTVRKYNN